MKVSTVLSYIDLKMFLILDINNLAHFPLDQWCPVSHSGVTHYFMRTNYSSFKNKSNGIKRKLYMVNNCIRFIKDHIFFYDDTRYVIVNTHAQILIHSSYQDIIPYED